MTAPKNMPTSVLRRMVEHSEAEVNEWQRNVQYHRDMLDNAIGALTRRRKELDELTADLKEREQEEAPMMCAQMIPGPTWFDQPDPCEYEAAPGTDYCSKHLQDEADVDAFIKQRKEDRI